MKVRRDTCHRGSHEMLRLKQVNDWLVAASVSFLLVAIGITLIYGPDSLPPVIFVLAGFGAFRTDSSANDLRNLEPEPQLGQLNSEHAILAHVKRVFQFGLAVLDAQSVSLKLWDTNSGQCVEWSMRRAGKPTPLIVTEPQPCLRQPRYDFLSALYVRKDQDLACFGVDWNQRPIRRSRLLDELQRSWRESFETLLLSQIHMGSRWQGTVIFLNAPEPARPRTALCILQQIVDVAISGSNLYQIAREDACQDERRRLARDLHDGVTQSLIATQLQLALLDRKNRSAPVEASKIIEDVQEILRGETRKLRMQIDDLQCAENSESVQLSLNRLALEFERETAILTTFACEVNADNQIPPALAFELVCLLQEALSNVRKHSGANRVHIKLRIAKEVHLHVQDDGHGFDFCGSFNLSQLQALQHWPRTICERVNANHGHLTLTTSPECGVRLEISLPLISDKDRTKPKPPVAFHSLNPDSQGGALRKSPRSSDGIHRVLRTL